MYVHSKCEIVIDYRVYTAYVHIWTYSPSTDYQPHTVKMVVVETLWQLHSLIVINSWFLPILSYVGCTVYIMQNTPCALATMELQWK